MAEPGFEARESVLTLPGFIPIVGRILRWPQDSHPVMYTSCTFLLNVGEICEYDGIVGPMFRD